VNERFLGLGPFRTKKIPIRSWDVLYPDEGALEFGDLETSTSPETETVGGLNYSTRLELGSDC
jgi:hypothetical protein